MRIQIKKMLALLLSVSMIVSCFSVLAGTKEADVVLAAEEESTLSSTNETDVDAGLYREKDDYSDYDYSFDDQLNPFITVTTETENTINQIVEDPKDPTNQVLKLEGWNSVFLLKYWPERAVLKTVTFRMYAPIIRNTTPPMALTSYWDIENYEGVLLGSLSSGDGRCRLRGEIVRDGLTTYKLDDGELDNSDWLTCTLAFGNNSVLTQVYDVHGNSLVVSLEYNPGGTFGFGLFGDYAHQPSRDYYIDDLHVELQNGPGDFDVNEQTSEINVYFAGNTFMRPDDTLTLTGERLYETSGDIYVGRLADNLNDVKNAAVMPGVVSQPAFDHNGDISGICASQVEHAKALTSYQAEVLQRSIDTINAVIPSEIGEEGIYAVRIMALKEGAEDRIIYVNRPDISFVSGNEGDIATHGGQIQIIGSNLAPTGSAEDITVKLVSKNTKEIHMLSRATLIVNEDNAYSVVAGIDSEIPYGEYEVYLHNGYGDNTTWSVPSEITIGSSPKEAWPDTVFNVKSYGAVGDSHSNDTPAIVDALAAAAENGGGIVYFPKGVYSVVTTLAIPENVTLLGDNLNDSVIRYQASRWQYGEAPEALISIIGNVEIKNLGIQGSRYSCIVQTYRPYTSRFGKDIDDPSRTTEADNIYITNVKFRFAVYSGYPSSGGNGFIPITNMTKEEVKTLLDAEVLKRPTLDMRGGTNNLQLDGMSLIADVVGGPTMRLCGRQMQIKDCSWSGYSLAATAYGLIMEGCDLEAPGFNPSGNGFYMHDNYLHDSFTNNRELMTTDGIGVYNNVKIRFIGDDSALMKTYTGESITDETAYLVNEGYWSTPSYEGYDVIVKNGQGQGQVRRIKKIVTRIAKTADGGDGKTHTVIYVDNPFTVSVNRLSVVDIYEPRVDMFFVENRFHEGAACGTSGTMINSVWDGNEFSQHGGQWFQVRAGSIWYTTLLNQRHYDAIYMHGEGWGTSGTASENYNKRQLSSQVTGQTSLYKSSLLAFCVRECEFDGYGFNIGSGGVGDGASGLVVENCIFENRSSAIDISHDRVSTMTAVLLRYNHYETDEVFGIEEKYVDATINSGAVNKQGYERIKMIDFTYDYSNAWFGDVNLDGFVTNKDVVDLRAYLCGKKSLIVNQMELGDANQDGKLSLKDVTIIRKMLTGEVAMSRWIYDPLTITADADNQFAYFNSNISADGVVQNQGIAFSTNSGLWPSSRCLENIQLEFSGEMKGSSDKYTSLIYDYTDSKNYKSLQFRESGSGVLYMVYVDMVDGIATKPTDIITTGGVKPGTTTANTKVSVGCTEGVKVLIEYTSESSISFTFTSADGATSLTTTVTANDDSDLKFNNAGEQFYLMFHKVTNPTFESITLRWGNAKNAGEADDGGETPGGETPGGETPGGETPGGETPGGETPGGETPGGETPGGETPGGETPEEDETGTVYVDNADNYFEHYSLNLDTDGTVSSYATPFSMNSGQWLNGKVLKSVELELSAVMQGSADNYMSLIYDYTDEQNYKSLQFRESNSGVLYMAFVDMVDGIATAPTDITATGGVRLGTMANKTTNVSVGFVEGAKVKIEYLSASEVSFTFTNSDGTVNFATTVTAADSSGLNFNAAGKMFYMLFTSGVTEAKFSSVTVKWN